MPQTHALSLTLTHIPSHVIVYTLRVNVHLSHHKALELSCLNQASFDSLSNFSLLSSLISKPIQYGHAPNLIILLACFISYACLTFIVLQLVVCPMLYLDCVSVTHIGPSEIVTSHLVRPIGCSPEGYCWLHWDTTTSWDQFRHEVCIDIANTLLSEFTGA